MKPAPHNRAQYGPPGEKIPGSQWIRDYCARCNEPLRVRGLYCEDGSRFDHYCEQCDPQPPRYQALAPHQESVRNRQSNKTL